MEIISNYHEEHSSNGFNFKSSSKISTSCNTGHIPEMLGVLVDDGGDDALHGAELRVQPEEHQHEEEEAAPQGREWHLKHCAWVRQEGETRSLGGF